MPHQDHALSHQRVSLSPSFPFRRRGRTPFPFQLRFDLLCFVLLSALLGNWPLHTVHAFATAPTSPAHVTTTIQSFLEQPPKLELPSATSISSLRPPSTHIPGAPSKQTKNTKPATTKVAQNSVSSLDTLDASGEPLFLTPAIPQQVSVGDNSGQFTDRYPINVVPGQGGMTPPINLIYSSESTNERHDGRAPASAVGEGWTLSMGSISIEHDASGQDWYFLSGIDGISDRLVPDINHAGFYLTEHLSHLRIQKDSGCFRVWDRSGTYSEFGCTSDALQTASIDGTATPYRYDLDKAYLPFTDPTTIRGIFVSYLQERNGENDVQEAEIKQITYGTVSTFAATTPEVIAGTVDFQYQASAVPAGGDNFVTSYGAHTCSDEAGDPLTIGGNQVQLTTRCDTPRLADGTPLGDAILSDMTLTGMTSYVGDHDAPAYRVTLSHADYFSSEDCSSFRIEAVSSSCAGDHLLTAIETDAYQDGTAYKTDEVDFSYQTATNTYYDPQPQGQTSPYAVQTTWKYLTEERDRFTNGGAQIGYGTADNNTNGTPTVTLADGTTDDARNPLYCWQHRNDTNASTRCEGSYAHPDERAWSTQVVTAQQDLGTSSSSLSRNTTTFAYKLAETATSGCNGACYSDVWTPAGNQEWANYYRGEYRGFNAVVARSSDWNTTVSLYESTLGPGSAQSDGRNFNAGQLYEQDVYWGTAFDATRLLRSTTVDYPGIPGTIFASINACDSVQDATYTPCLVVPLRSSNALYELQTGTAPSTQIAYTYDDLSQTSNYNPTGYHNLLKTVTSSSNAPTITQQWTYQINDSSQNGEVYYTVDAVASSQIIDANNHVWQCQNFTYDEGGTIGSADAGGGPGDDEHGLQ